MDDIRHKRSDWPLWFGIICGALVPYFGAYCAMATRHIDAPIVSSFPVREDGSVATVGLRGRCSVYYSKNS